jgi:large subunit ribosomal protein L17
MRHLKRTAKLGRQFEHRNAMLSNMVCSLIKHKRITTTLAKAKAARSVAEKIVTLGKKGTLQARRLAAARLHTHGPTVELSKAEKKKWRAEEDVIRILFEDIAPAFKGRVGGYTRIIKLEQRPGDSAPKAILEWVDEVVTAPAPEAKAEDKKEKEAAAAK